MKPIYDAWLIQIEITNHCLHACAHCTRAIRHISKPFFADLNFIEKSLQSLAGWKRCVGCMGGEPTLHPEFEAICSLYKKYFPRKRCALFTSGGPKFEKHKALIRETFGVIHYHNHTVPAYHQPCMVASQEVIADEHFRKTLIRECWLQRKWSPAISIKGGFFCEVAATFDLLFNGPGGYAVKPGWWRKNESHFTDQVQRYCGLCSIPIPMVPLPADMPYEYVSKRNAERLVQAQSPLALAERITIIDEIYTKDMITAIRKNPAYREPFHYAKKNKKTYTCTAPLLPKLWSRNIKSEMKHFLRTGKLLELLRSIRG